MIDDGYRAGRIHELDALRGIAALGVVGWHYGAHFNALPLKALLLPFYNGGFLLVDFFFVLSGYVIARAYWRETRQWYFAKNVVTRLARLYPLHLLTLAVTAVLISTIPSHSTNSLFNPDTTDLKHFLLNVVLLNQSGLQDSWSFNTPAWSISTEFIVNVAFLAFISMTTKARALTSIVLVVAAMAFAVSQRTIISGDYLLGFLDINLARCAVGFGAGVAIYFCLDRLDGTKALVGRPALASILGGISLLSLVVLMISAGRHPAIWYYLASIIVAAGCVLFIPFSPFLRKMFGRKSLIYLGDISYSTYLIHYPIQLAFYSISLRMDVDFASPITLALYGAAVVGISAITHRCVEVPAQRHLLAIATRKELVTAH